MNEQTGATIPIPFALGVPVWWVGHGYREEWVTCPECAGTKKITMILGNGDAVELWCGNCAQGYEPASGLVRISTYHHTPERFTPERVRVDGEEISYLTDGHGIVYASNLFLTEAECLAACEALNAKKNAEDEARRLSITKSKRRDLAWSVSYWRNQVKRLREDLARTEAHLMKCEQRKRRTKEPQPLADTLADAGDRTDHERTEDPT
jgi:hypothetical protein